MPRIDQNGGSVGDFVTAALAFPTVLFSAPLLVVVGYWLLVVVGVLDVDGDGADLSWVGLGGVPLSVTLSLLLAFAWFASLAGNELADDHGLPYPGLIALGAALIGAWLLTRLLVLVLRKAMPAGFEPSRSDFVGRTAIIRTGRVTRDFGQAEVAAADGSTAIVQVRQTGTDQLRAGQPAVLYDFDVDGEFFWVVPADVVHHPEQKDR